MVRLLLLLRADNEAQPGFIPLPAAIRQSGSGVQQRTLFQSMGELLLRRDVAPLAHPVTFIFVRSVCGAKLSE